MWRFCIVSVICAGCGCGIRQAGTASSRPVREVRPPASMPQVRAAASQSAGEAASVSMRSSPVVATPSVAQTEPAYLIPIEESGVMMLHAVGYEAYDFGPVGRRIIAERRPEDMARLKRTLEYTDGPRTVVVEEFLPMRHCDYAALIAETLLHPNSSYSWGPRDAYEYRDDIRRGLVKDLFGGDAIPPQPVKYIYLDASGKDVSEEIRATRRPGTP